MPRTAVPKSFKRLTDKKRNIPIQYPAQFGSMPEEIRPSTVRSRIAAAQNGDLGALHVLYKQMVTDARYAGIGNSLKSSVALCPFDISQGEKSNRASKLAVKLVKEQFKKLNVVRTIKKMVTPYFTGSYVAAMNWESLPTAHASNNAAWFRGLTKLDPSRLMVGVDTLNDRTFQKLLVTSIDFPEGKPVDEFQEGSILWADDGETDEGYYHLAGAARRCLGWWLGKLYTTGFWSEYNETFAEPIRVGYIDADAGTKEKAQLEQFLRFMGRNMYGIFPENTEIDLMQAGTNGTINTFSEYIALANNEMSVAITGEIESSGSGNKFGSNAKAETHLKVRSEVIGSVVAEVNEQLKEVVDHICRLNIDPQMEEGEKPVVALNVPRPEDKAVIATMYNTITGFMEVSESQIRRDLELSKPEDGEETIGPESRSKQLQSGSAANEVPAKERPAEDRKTVGEAGKEVSPAKT